MQLTLSSPVQYVPRVGPTMAKRLEKLRIHSVKDLLYYAPFRYNDFSLVSPVNRVQPGEIVTVAGRVESMKNVYTKTGKKIQQAIIRDETGELEVVWFNQPFLIRTILPGLPVNFSGPIRWFGHKVVMESPDYEVLEPQLQERNLQVSLHTARLVPVYPETQGVTSKWLRGRIAFIIGKCISQVFEYIPDSILMNYDLMTINDALRNIHFPQDKEVAARARRRLAFEELLLLQLLAYTQKRQWQEEQKSFSLKIEEAEINNLITRLPFKLTSDQIQAVEEILADLAKPVPMNRLLEGDVGSGKTVVAAIAMYTAYRGQKRSVLMAPTQILAQQHYQTIKNLLDVYGVEVEFVTGGTHKRKRTGANSMPTSHISPAILVGTHALLSRGVDLNGVGLIVIDEQQRFGVVQRSLLIQKDQHNRLPHLLTMTATPIPRTVARTIYSNLDLSVLNQMPLGRTQIKTWVVPKDKRESAYDWIKKQLQQTGGQAYIVCPLIEESESLASVKAVKTEYERLKAVFPQFSLGLLHGRMKLKEKTTALERFRTQKDAILLATPVVEVGIDIPNAIIILIEAAERFGLAQLHQLRGRVGRGRIASFCLLFTEQEDEAILKRLKFLETIYSGPELAELDLKLRGPGELFGTKQHGVPLLKIASFADTELIRETQQALKGLTAADPTLSQFSLLREKLAESKIKSVASD